jgi:hypothetical protein
MEAAPAVAGPGSVAASINTSAAFGNAVIKELPGP